MFPYSEYLPDLFGNAVLATTELTKRNPDLVKRFREAMLKALEYTIEHPDEAAALLHQKQPETAADAASRGDQTDDAVRDGGGHGCGDRRDRAGRACARAIASLRSARAHRPAMTPEDVVDFDVMPGG